MNMKLAHCIRNFFIASVSLLGITWMYRRYTRSTGPLVRVIVFHDVCDSEWFRKSITLITSRYHVLTPDDFLHGIFDEKRINVLITFDDGYASWVTTCLPIFNEKNIRALFFINSGLIDVYGNTEMQEQYMRDNLLLTPRKSLSWDGVRALHNAGHMIGGHTSTHARLATCEINTQEREIVDDKKRIETMIGSTLSTFAYPFGQRNDYTDSTESLVRKADYVRAFTTEGTFVSSGDPYRTARLCIEDDLSVLSLAWWIEGGYDIYRKLKNLCVR